MIFVLVCLGLIINSYRHIVECWHTLAGDSTLLQSIFDRCLDLLARNVHVNEKIDHKSKKILAKVANLLPMAVSIT